VWQRCPDLIIAWGDRLKRLQSSLPRATFRSKAATPSLGPMTGLQWGRLLRILSAIQTVPSVAVANGRLARLGLPRCGADALVRFPKMEATASTAAEID
jgi:hypothetical protein